MQFATHRAELLRSGPGGVDERTRLEASAKLGNAVAIQKLTWPRFPDALAYLDDWYSELSAGRGDSMNGIAPFTHRGVESWSRTMQRDVEPHEVKALLLLDGAVRAVLLKRDEDPKAASKPGEQAHADVVRPTWPTKRPEASS